MMSNGRFCVVADKGVLWRTVRPFPNTVRLTRDEIVHLKEAELRCGLTRNKSQQCG